MRRLALDDHRNIILAGFMGTGKTTVGRRLAKRLGRTFLDTDRIIEERQGRTISEIFQSEGEEYFRALEKELCEEIVQQGNAVVATGGGLFLDRDNRRTMSRSGIILRLACTPEAALERIGSGRNRPKVADDPTARVKQLLAEREPMYASLPFQIDTTGCALDQVVDDIVHVLSNVGKRLNVIPVSLPDGGGYSIAVGDGILDLVGPMLRNRKFTSRVAVVADENVAKLHADTAMESLRNSGFEPSLCVMPPGEQSKSHEHLLRLYGRFLEIGLDRKGVVVAIGGGVIGDLAGFAAASYMRGVALVHCPTTLLAMVDSSVGGKTGVDLPQGKNLVGAFKQPVFVISDTGTLASLPPREVRMGMAEVIKHTVIDDADLFMRMERESEALKLTPELIRRSVAVKVRVVETDLFEAGRREVLNLGHTVGHALEQVSGYRIGHGDAVAIGLVAVARMSAKMELTSPEVSDRIETLLVRYGFPVRHNCDLNAITAAMTADKKTLAGRVRFVLVRDVGTVEPGLQVPQEIIREVLDELRDPGGAA
jgi:3-dehydroquinate synthase